MQTKQSYDMFIGSYGSKDESTISWLTFDTKQGTFHEVMTYKGIENPSYLTINKDRTRLYAISEVTEGTVQSFFINQHTKNIHPLNKKPTHGAPCYVMLDEDEQYVFSANYGGGSIIRHHLTENGEIGESSDFLAHKPTQSNRTSHIHTIRQVPHTHYYVATDLGQDKLYVYTLSTDACLTLYQTIDLPIGSGPRHVSFHPTLDIMYVVSEFLSMTYTFTYDNALNHMNCIQSSPTLPKGFEGDNFGADIHVTPSGKFLFTSNRGHHSMTTYSISCSGIIEPVAYTPTLGEWPRNFTILPNSPYIIIANEHTNNIVGMIMKENGKLEQVTNPYTIHKPVCVQPI